MPRATAPRPSARQRRAAKEARTERGTRNFVNEAKMIDGVHIDVLALVFGFINLRPRMLIVSTVCKRWRTAALRSVTAISFRGYEPDGFRTQSTAPCFALLRNLQELELSLCHGFRGVIALPASLRDLAITDSSAEALPLSNPFAELPPLQRFTMRDVANCSACIPLLAAARTSLTSISIVFGAGRGLWSKPVPYAEEEPVMEFLASRRFPALARLHFGHNSPCEKTVESYAAFVRNHAPQLVTLDLRSDEVALLNARRTIAFPKLRKLYPSEKAIASDLSDLSSLAPQLSSIVNPSSISVCDSSLPWLTAVTKLSVCVSNRPSLPSAIARLPHLKSLAVFLDGSVRPLVEAGLALKIREVTFCLPPDAYTTASLLAVCTNLRRLDFVNCGDAPGPFATPHALPYMESLIFDQVTCHADNGHGLLSCIEGIASVSPRLKCLWVLSLGVFPSELGPRVRRLLATLQGRLGHQIFICLEEDLKKELMRERTCWLDLTVSSVYN